MIANRGMYSRGSARGRQPGKRSSRKMRRKSCRAGCELEMLAWILRTHRKPVDPLQGLSAASLLLLSLCWTRSTTAVGFIWIWYPAIFRCGASWRPLANSWRPRQTSTITESSLFNDNQACQILRCRLLKPSHRSSHRTRQVLYEDLAGSVSGSVSPRGQIAPRR